MKLFRWWAYPAPGESADEFEKRRKEQADNGFPFNGGRLDIPEENQKGSKDKPDKESNE